MGVPGCRRAPGEGAGTREWVRLGCARCRVLPCSAHPCVSSHHGLDRTQFLLEVPPGISALTGARRWSRIPTMGSPLRCIFIVARDQPALWDHLRRDFAEDKEVQVTLDRRGVERRQSVRAHDAERRRAARRRPPSIDTDLRYHSFVILHEQQGTLPG